jgi:hypothetical protein
MPKIKINKPVVAERAEDQPPTSASFEDESRPTGRRKRARRQEHRRRRLSTPITPLLSIAGPD